MSQMTDFTLPSCVPGRTLHAFRCVPEGEVRAILQLSHGMVEFIDRYKPLAEYLAARGILVTGHDHLGHGGSIRTKADYGYFAQPDGNRAVLDDLHAVTALTKQLYPGVPYFLLGHSMGSFLLRTYLYTYPDAVDKAVISGTGWEDPTKVRLGKLVCKLEQARVGETSTSKLVTKLMFGSYNKPFGAVTSPNAWICSDEAVVAAYDADPLCGFDATVGLARDLLTGVEMNEQPENLDKMNKQLPLLFVSGSKDPVGGMAKGVLRCIDAFKRSGMKDITIKLYPEGRHEMLNERNKAEVYQDILDWLER